MEYIVVADRWQFVDAELPAGEDSRTYTNFCGWDIPNIDGDDDDDDEESVDGTFYSP